MEVACIAVLLCAVAASDDVAASASPEAGTNTVAGPPELAVAVFADGHFVEVRRFVTRMVRRTTTSNLPPGLKIEVKRGTMEPASSTEVVPVVETHITRIDATKIVARRIDGRAVSSNILAEELARPMPVVLVKQGQPVDPLFLTIFKPDSLMLLLPSSSGTPPPTMLPDYMVPGNRAGSPVPRACRGTAPLDGSEVVPDPANH
jgi:hypothetical protein